MKILKSFKFALKGIIYTLKNERNMRIHTVVSASVLFLSLFFNFNIEKYLILFLTMALVMVSELINSAVEGLVDFYSKNYSSAAKIAKDIAAGAVLIASGFAAAIGVLLFHDVSSYLKMWRFLCSYPFSFSILALFLALTYFYIFWGPAEIKHKAKKIRSKINRS